MIFERKFKGKKFLYTKLQEKIDFFLKKKTAFFFFFFLFFIKVDFLIKPI